MKTNIFALWLLLASYAFASGFITPTASSSGITSINGDSTAAQLIVSGTAGSDVAIATAGGTTTVNIPTASATKRGALSSADWTTFNSKQAAGSYITALTSDVSATGPGSAAATVNTVGGQTAANVAAGAVLANAATSANTANAIVKRGASGEFSAGPITYARSGSSSYLFDPKIGAISQTELVVQNQTAGSGASSWPLLSLISKNEDGLSDNCFSNYGVSDFAGGVWANTNGGGTCYTSPASGGPYYSLSTFGFGTAPILDLHFQIQYTDYAILKTTGQFQFFGGSVGTPSISFINDPDVGLYSSGTNEMSVGLNGVQEVIFNTAYNNFTQPIRIPNGTAGAPSLTLSNDTNTGLFTPSPDALSIATGGVQRFTVDTASATSTLPYLAPAGTAAAPAHSFSGDPDTGIYDISADNLGFSAGGTLRVTINTTGVTSTLPWLGSAGTAGAPSISFSGDPDTGLFSSAANQLGISTGGTQRATIDSTALTLTPVVLGPAGSVSAPAYSASGDTNTGVYFPAADQFAVTAGGRKSVLVKQGPGTGGRLQVSGDGQTIGSVGATQSLDVYADSTGSFLNFNVTGGSLGYQAVNVLPPKNSHDGSLYWAFNLVGSADDDQLTNGEILEFAWDGVSGFVIDSFKTGTGSDRPISINASSGGSNQIKLNTNGSVQIGADSGTAQHVLNTATQATGSNTLTMTNAPAAITGNPAGYEKITINGTTRYRPFW